MKNNSKLKTQNSSLVLLGWRADENLESGILKTVNWYIRKYTGKIMSEEL